MSVSTRDVKADKDSGDSGRSGLCLQREETGSFAHRFVVMRCVYVSDTALGEAKGK